MPVIKGLGWTFDTVASAYARLRPGYDKPLYQAVFDYSPIDASSRVVEVGIGGGQATEPVLKTGCRLTAVEPGAHFSAICGSKFQDYPNFAVITGKFEDTAFEEGAYDLIYSASAFHWVPEEIGYPKVYAMLKSGGAFARFANHPCRDKGNPALAGAIDAAYKRYYDPYHHKSQEQPQEYGERQARARAMIAEKYGFTDIRYALFHRTRDLTAQEYVALLGTYSDHIALQEPARARLFDEIEGAINRYGGVITLYDTIDLQLARKP